MEPFRDFTTMKRGAAVFVLFTVVILFFIPSPIPAEQIRGKIRHFIELPEDYSEVVIDIGLRELASLDIESEEFLRGFIIEVVSPPSVLEFRQSFLLSFYRNISPSPGSGSGAFSGTKVDGLPFPVTRRSFVDIPLRTSTGWEKSTPDSRLISPPLRIDQFPLLLFIDPVMKGIPSSVDTAIFQITLKPILKDSGAVRLKVPQDIETGTVYFLIDGKDIGDPSEKHYLKPGVHTLEVKSDVYIPFKRSFGVDRARTTTIDISLKPSKSFVHFQAPDGAAVFFDGKEINLQSDDTFETEPGDHVVLMRIGDYSVSKKINVQGGKNYKVSLFFDILIDDN